MPKRRYTRPTTSYIMGREEDMKLRQYLIDTEGPFSWHGLLQELEVSAEEEAQLRALEKGQVLVLDPEEIEDYSIRVVRLSFDADERGFKEFPTIGWPKFLGMGWEDVSWHNDAMARAQYDLVKGNDDGPALALWVDFDDPHSREWDEAKKYTLVFEPEGYSSGDAAWEIIRTEDAHEVEMRIAAFLAEFVPTTDVETAREQGETIARIMAPGKSND